MRSSGAKWIGWWLGVAAVAAIGAPRAGAADFVFPQSGPCTSNWSSSRPYGTHQALDIAGANRSAITAGRGGTISFYGWSGGYGNLMIVTHEAGYTTYYGHLSGSARGTGSHVNTGDTIAYEGSTGNSTGPHVHYEVRRYGTKVYVPGAVGAYFTRGNGLPYDYPGIGETTGGGGGGGSSGGGAQANADAAKVTTSALNVRTGPSTGNASIGLVHAGEIYISSHVDGQWRKIWFDGRTGWVHRDYIVHAAATAEVVNTDALNVRSGPSTSNSVVKTIGRGERYARAGTSGAWEKIYFGGTTRWVHGDYTSEAGY
jgi:murein DD-endopeptidase MepM/ murein hydrolase activator NlpD